MKLDAVITLVNEKTDVDDLGYLNTEIIGEKLVFCNVKSASQSEFYKALEAGYNIAIVFDVRYADYSGEKLIRYGGTEYKVIRTYRTTIDNIELSCSEKGF